MVEVGDEVWSYNIPGEKFVVLVKGVEKDVEIPDYCGIIRVDGGDTVLESLEREGIYAVVPERLLSPT